MPDEPRRSRYKRPSYRLDEDTRQKVVTRVLDFYERDLADRSASRDIRIQREAKLRGWVEETDWPWPGASNIALTDIEEKSLRMQDSLMNAITMSVPVVPALAVNDADREKQQQVDALLHHQFFVDQPGEATLSELAQAFTDDGVYTALVVWVTETKEVGQTALYPKIPEGVPPAEHFAQIIVSEFGPDTVAEPKKADDPWDFTVYRLDHMSEAGEPKKLEVKFYTQTGTEQIEMSWNETVVAFDGPRVLPKDYDDVLYPPRSANLQPPGPSNPRGAPHVIFRDYPTVDEIRDLQRSGFYDIAKSSDVDSMETRSGTPRDDERERFRDDAEGVTIQQPDVKAKQHRRVTRLLCFDQYDIDGDGLAEDVVWWVIEDTKTLCRARALSEFFPCVPPRRPIAEGSFLPVRGRRDGISIVELLEGIHDASKQLIDQAIDSGTITNSPIGFFRPMGPVNPAELRLIPGMLMPMNDPQRDIYFPSLGNNQSAAFALNFFTMLQGYGERVSMVGDAQFGRVPAGKSSALRTAAGQQMLAAQGAARPERVFRRFMDGVRSIWEIMHAYNQRFLTEPKQVRLIGFKRPEESPYITVGPRKDVSGNFQFSFRSQGLLDAGGKPEALLQFGQLAVVNPLSLQAGLVTPEGLYRFFSEFGNALGLEASSYIQAPTPDAQKVRMTAEEAFGQIVHGLMPDGVPAEFGGWIEHAQKLDAFSANEGMMEMLQPRQVQELLIPYMQHAATQAIATQQRMQMAQAAAMGMGGGGGGQGGPTPTAGPPDMSQPQVSGNDELLDESLPSAGGGAQR